MDTFRYTILMEKLDDLLLFVDVVQHNSFTQAAEERNQSKSMVSKRISRLEATLKTQLLNRTTRSLSLTESGELFFQHCKAIKLELDAAMLSLTQSQAEPQGVLKVSAPTSFGYSHLAKNAGDFMVQHKKVTVDLILGSKKVDIIEEGFDLAIRVGELPDSALIARKLASRPMRVIGAPSYFKTHGTPKTPEDLRQHNCLMYHALALPETWEFVHRDQARSIKVSGNFHCNSAHALLEAAHCGIGIAMLPGFLATNYIKNGSLLSILGEFCPKDIAIHAVYPQSRYQAPKTRAFLNFLYEQYQDKHYWNN